MLATAATIALACNTSSAPGPSPAPTLVPTGSPTIGSTPPIVNGKQKGAANVSHDLVSLYQEYQAYLSQPGDTEGFKPGNPELPVLGNLVVIDAVAAIDGDELKSDLEARGLQNSAVSGYLVSGLLPIDVIGSLNEVESLKFARPAYARANLR